MHKIPFNKPFVTGQELGYVTEVIASGAVGSDGRFTRLCARLLEERFGIHKVLMTPSCTDALEMAFILADLGPGDEVLVPSFTFVSTVNAFLRLGAKPVFVDIRPDTLNMDDALLEAAITPRTRAIAPVHYAGVGCEMARIMTIAEKYGLTVVEDAAQGVHAYYEDRALGSIGHLAAYSFHETKNYVCGEGGALCINAPRFLERAEILRDKGTNRAKFFRGEVDKYTWVDIGSSFLPSEITCAFLYAQLEALDSIGQRRREIYELYRAGLEPFAEQGLLRLPHVPDECATNHHMFYILLRDVATRDELMGYLRGEGISAVFHYVPLHTSPMGERLGNRAGQLPVTEELSSRLLRLPFYCELTDDDQRRVIGHIGAFLTSRRAERVAPVAPRVAS
jgi:dTDP-4-amino-4,6-dideoxygalactose transaminase